MKPTSSVVDLFCGVGGLTHGFVLEGFNVTRGIDIDPYCKYPYEKNNNTQFTDADISTMDPSIVDKSLGGSDIRILVGCAPCQPFSSYTNKLKEKSSRQWSLLTSFGEIIGEVQPDIISMENVPSLSSKKVFYDFVEVLKKNEYFVTWSNVKCQDYGVPQRRTRLVLFASKFGKLEIFPPTHKNKNVKVRDAIKYLPKIKAGESHQLDPLHRASMMSKKNVQRIKASKPGGTWKDWNPKLRAACHKRQTGESYYNVYGRMSWDDISPTITTQFTGFGNGRFGHPEQDRGLSLREGAILQTFPIDYDFIDPSSRFYASHMATLIGNAVPVSLARAIARSIKTHLSQSVF